MFCSQCGAAAGGNFCSQCGASLQAFEETNVQDWSELLDYEALLRIRTVRERIRAAATQCTRHLTGEEFLDLCDKAFKPFFHVPLGTLAKVAQPLYAKLGVRTTKLRTYELALKPGTALVEILCSLARNGQTLQNVQQTSGECNLQATIPSDVFSFAGEVVITVRRHTCGTWVQAGTLIKGQLFDWGKSSRCLDRLFSTLPKVA